MTAVGSATLEKYPAGVFVTVFNGNEEVLVDHIINGRKTLPGTAYLEMARAAVELAADLNDEYIISLHECLFIQPILVSETCAVEVKVYPGSALEFGIEVSTEMGTHFQCKASARKSDTFGNVLHGKISVDALELSHTAKGPERDEFYKNFSEKGIVLGPSHKGIQRIKLGHRSALVWANIKGASARGMKMDPGMLDCFIQSAAVLADNLSNGVRLPFALNELRVIAPLTDSMVAHIEDSDKGINFLIADLDGNVKIEINGFVGRDIAAATSQLNYFSAYWKPDADHHNSDTTNTLSVEIKEDFTAQMTSILSTAASLVKTKETQASLLVKLGSHQRLHLGVVGGLKVINKEYENLSHRIVFDEQPITLQIESVDHAGVTPVSWHDGKTHLITGGAGSLGRLVALDIARNSQHCTLILTGRRAKDAVIQQLIDELEATNATAHYICCDIASEHDLNSIVKKYPAISSVFHCAGVIRDNYIVNKSSEEVFSVLSPKVTGIQVLDQATRHLNLDYFVAFSSIAAVTGNAGQFDYAAANAFMDAYIGERANWVREGKRKGKSISINWPLWQGDGMTVDQETMRNLKQVLRIELLPPDQGLLALKTLLASSTQQAVVVYGSRQNAMKLFDGPSPKKRLETHKPAAQQKADEKLLASIISAVKQQTTSHLKRQDNNLDENADWATFGLDSILLAGLVNRFNASFDLGLLPTVFFEATSIKLFSEHLVEHHFERVNKLFVARANTSETARYDERATSIALPAASKSSTDFSQRFRDRYFESQGYRDKDIAIIGISCRIAGARNLDEFWQVLNNERDMIVEIPADRWDWREYPESRKWGSFIDGVSEFDPLFFGISPAEAVYINPEQRLIMQYVWECLENAGCGGDVTRGSDTGIFVGCGASAYTEILNDFPVEAYTATGEVTSVGPNRMSYLMDWHGPSNPVETACSSALVAVHRAVEAIRLGHCSQAIAGGVNLLLTPHAYISFSKAGMLADDGRCKTFSDRANGYVRGEGVGMIMLKPVNEALRDGNHIYAVIKGTAENHGGRTNSLTAPNPKSQAAVIKKAIADADIDFSRVGYIECHGTGTELGDPVEVNGLRMVAKSLLNEAIVPDSCKLGSIKSNVGHLEFAAGIAGLIKVVLQIKHKKIARSLHCEKLNPYIDLNNTPFSIAQKSSRWEANDGVARVGGVSSFGFGGVNAHIVIEEYRQTSDHRSHNSSEDADIGKERLLILSAKSRTQLTEYAISMLQFIESQNDVNLNDELDRIAYTLQVGRTEFPARVAFVAQSIDEWRSQLVRFSQGDDSNDEGGHCVSGVSRPDRTPGDEIQNHPVSELRKMTNSDIAKYWVRGGKVDWKALNATDEQMQ